MIHVPPTSFATERMASFTETARNLGVNLPRVEVVDGDEQVLTPADLRPVEWANPKEALQVLAGLGAAAKGFVLASRRFGLWDGHEMVNESTWVDQADAARRVGSNNEWIELIREAAADLSAAATLLPSTPDSSSANFVGHSDLDSGGFMIDEESHVWFPDPGEFRVFNEAPLRILDHWVALAVNGGLAERAARNAVLQGFHEHGKGHTFQPLLVPGTRAAVTIDADLKVLAAWLADAIDETPSFTAPASDDVLLKIDDVSEAMLAAHRELVDPRIVGPSLSDGVAGTLAIPAVEVLEDAARTAFMPTHAGRLPGVLGPQEASVAFFVQELSGSSLKTGLKGFVQLVVKASDRAIEVALKANQAGYAIFDRPALECFVADIAVKQMLDTRGLDGMTGADLEQLAAEIDAAFVAHSSATELQALSR